MDYSPIFTVKHLEKLLKPVSDLVTAIRNQDIRVWALEFFTPEHISVLGGESSVSVLQGDKLPARTIILNASQVGHYSSVCDFGYTKALEMTIWHELSHISIFDNFGVDAACSEFDTWAAVERLNIVPPEDFKNFRDYAMHRRPPTFDHRQADQAPEWLRGFSRLAPSVGYNLAWGVTKNLADKAGLASWQITDALIQNGWEASIAIRVVEDKDPSAALFDLAVAKRDMGELHGLSVEVNKPASTQPIKKQIKLIPEQPVI